MAGAFLILSISAYYLLRGRHLDFARASLKVGLGFATVATLLQMVSGDFTAKGVAKNQPVKFAALEGVYETRPYTPINVIGWADSTRETDYGLKIPGLLSFLATGHPAQPVIGLKDLPPADFLQQRYPEASPEKIHEIRRSYWPNVPAVFQFYHIMILIGGFLFLTVVVGCFLWWRGMLFDTRLRWTRYYLIVLVLSVLGPQIANQAGWFTAEMGRQPWIVYELLKTSQAFSRVVSAEHIVFSLALFAFVYTLLFAVFVYILSRKIQHGPDDEEESHEMPESWRAMIRRDEPRAES